MHRSSGQQKTIALIACFVASMRLQRLSTPACNCIDAWSCCSRSMDPEEKVNRSFSRGDSSSCALSDGIRASSLMEHPVPCSTQTSTSSLVAPARRSVFCFKFDDPNLAGICNVNSVDGSDSATSSFFHDQVERLLCLFFSSALPPASSPIKVEKCCMSVLARDFFQIARSVVL